MEFLAHGQQPLAITVFAKENADTKKRNEALQATKEASRRGEIEQDLSSLTSSRKPFTWEDLKVCPASSRLSFDSSRLTYSVPLVHCACAWRPAPATRLSLRLLQARYPNRPYGRVWRR